MRKNKKFDEIQLKKHADTEETEKGKIKKRIGKSLEEFGNENSPKWRDDKNSARFTYARKNRTEKYRFRPEAVTPSPKAPFILLLCSLCLSAAGAFFLNSDFVFGLDFNTQSKIKIAVTVLAYGLCAVVYMIRKRNLKSGSISKFSPKYTPFLLLSLGLVLCLSALQKYVIAYVFTYRVPVGGAAGTTAMCILTEALVPAIFEELLVRGVIQRELSEYAGGFGGVVISSFAFALLHFDIRFFGVYLTAGLVLGTVCHVTGSVIPAMIVHFLNNFLSVVFSDKLTFVALERIGGTLLIVVLASLCFVLLMSMLKSMEKISSDRAVKLLMSDENGGEGEKSEDKEEGDGEIFDDVILFKSKSGRTLLRTVKLFANPVFVVCIVVFGVCVAFLMN